MNPRPQSFYARWRLEGRAAIGLREDRERPAERLLQQVWYHQRLSRDRLTTLDGRRVQVLHPGFWSHEGGPDFRKAIIQFEGESPVTGDIEVDLHSSGWHGHGHDTNPAFKQVILHVVWEGAQIKGIPTLAIKDSLDAPISELVAWLGTESGKGFPPELIGKCGAPLRDLPEKRLRTLLHEAARVRLESKAAHLESRARKAGWEQALWEGLFRGLGYKHNVWPMLRLAELRPRLAPPKPKVEPLALQARLFGAGGLLPHELERADSQPYFRKLWDCWWRERDAFADCVLPRALWHFHALRPANHPQRRLALASYWWIANKLVTDMGQWNGTPEDLLRILQAPDDPFWSWHWTLRSPRLRSAQPLLGPARLTDLAINVVLPWLWARDPDRRNEIEQRYFEWPAGEDNSLLRLARQRLLGTTSRKVLGNAAAQQGLLQIVRDFCEHSNALCENCRFPELVRSWGNARSDADSVSPPKS
jgi:uncharacterized protein DUF2851